MKFIVRTLTFAALLGALIWCGAVLADPSVAEVTVTTLEAAAVDLVVVLQDWAVRGREAIENFFIQAGS